MASKLDQKVRKAVVSVRRRKILDRILALIRYYKPESFEERADHVRLKGSLSLTIGGASALFYVESYGQFHQNTLYQVRYGGSLLLEARHGLRDEVADGVDPRLVTGNKSHAIVVLTYKPGLWMQLLDLKRLIRQDVRRRQDEERRRREALRPRPAEPEVVSDFDIKQRFALR